MSSTTQARNIEEINAEISRLREEAQQLEVERTRLDRERQAQIRAAIRACPWEYEVTAPRWMASDHRPSDAVKVLRRHRITDPELLKVATQDDRQWVGMIYYRTEENILNYMHGGTYVLRTPMLCSDEEWAAIKRGEIPAKFETRRGEEFIR